MGEIPDEVPTQLRISRRSDAPDPAPIYSNYVQANFTIEDFTMHFGWYTVPPISEPPADGIIDAPLEPVARVVLPVILVRNLIEVLKRQLEGYERNFGPVPEHPNKPQWMTEVESKHE